MFLITQITALVISHPFWSTFVALLVAYNLLLNCSKKCNLPGPYGLPFVGYLPFLLPRPYEEFSKLSKKYGPIFQVKVGPNNLVIISSLELGSEAFNSDIAFHGRTDNFSIRTFTATSFVTFSFRPASEAWRLLRKVSIRALGLFASSKNSKLETVVREAQFHFNSTLEQQLDEPFDPQNVVLESVATVIGSILFGFEFDVNHPLVKNLRGSTKVFSDFLAIAGVADNVPLPDYFFSGAVKKFKERTHSANSLISQFMAKHEYVGKDDEVRDVADALTKTSEQSSEIELEKSGVARKSIRNITADLFGAGFATTADSFHWFLNLLATNVAVQQQCQREIDGHLAGRQVSLEDKGKMPYVDATITEMFRFISLTPMGLPHSMLEDTVFKGYFLPKGTIVYLNMYAIHYDENIFPDPDQLRPERFIRADGTFDTEKSTKVIIFGLGKRRCVGETLARQELFMLFVATLQKFSIRLAPGQKVNFKVGDYGFTRIPHNLELVFSKR